MSTAMTAISSNSKPRHGRCGEKHPWILTMANGPGGQWSSRSRNSYQVKTAQIEGDKIDEMLNISRFQRGRKTQGSHFGTLLKVWLSLAV